MSAPPPVSVIIVNSGRRAELTLALTSLRYQRHPNFEVIVVSDASKDERPKPPYPVRWLSFGERNISAARNRGIAAARGEVVAFLDDDAVPEFGWLDALVAPFDDPDVGAAGGFTRGRNGVSFQWRAQVVDRLGRDRAIALDPKGADWTGKVFPPGQAQVPKTVGTNCAFRRDALVGIGGFDEAFRFFLDETDLNRRLSEAGWSTAIVPAAEVHHGFAESALRSRFRVPRSLFEIGASLSHFLNVHAPKPQRAARLEEFRAEQVARLDRFFLLGDLSAAGVKGLLAELDAGFADGASRSPKPGKFPKTKGVFSAARRGVSGKRRCFRGAGQSEPALQAAADGDEVTLIVVEMSARNLTVQFTDGGYFLHRMGLLGKVERDKPRAWGGSQARIRAEMVRVKSQRGPYTT